MITAVDHRPGLHRRRQPGEDRRRPGLLRAALGGLRQELGPVVGVAVRGGGRASSADMHEDGTLTAHVGEVVRPGPHHPAVTTLGERTPGSGSSSPRRAVPFRVKIAAVWVVLFLVLALPRQRRRLRRRSGSATTSATSSAGSATRWSSRVVRHRAGRRDGAARGARPDLPQPGGVRRGRLLRLVLPRHPADRADVPALPGPAAGRAQPGRELRLAARRLRPGARPRGRDRGHPRPRASTTAPT